MLKAHDVLKKISEDPALMAEFKKAKSFDELYDLCKKIEPSITEKEVKDSMRRLITENSKNNVSSLSNEELAAIAGGSMDFNKTKALALSALMFTGVSSMTMFSNNAYATGTPETTSISQKAQTEEGDQEILDQALLQAVVAGNKTLVEELLDQGASANAQSHFDYKTAKMGSLKTALGFAAENGHIDLVILLLEKGASINANLGYKNTALRLAAENGHIDIVSYLLDHGAKSHQEDALSCAIDYNQTDVVKLLLERGANADKKDFWTKFSLLMEAAREGKADIVKLLLDHGASVLAKDNEGKIAYDYASTDEVRKILKEAAKKSGLFEKITSKIKYWTGLDRFF